MRMTAMLRVLAAAAVAALLVAAAAGCGGDDGDDDPAGLLDDAASKRFTSANVDLRVAADVPGFPILGSELAVTAKGPVESNGADALPDADLDVSLEGGGQGFPARVTAVDGRAFVDFQFRPYEVDPELLERFGVGPGEGGDGQRALSLRQLGLDPSAWLRQVETADGEEIDGDETRLVTGRVNTEAVVEDLVALAGTRNEGNDLPELSDDQVAAVSDAVRRLDVEVNVDDEGYPRRVHAELDFRVPDSVENTAIEEGSASFDLELSAIDEATVDVRPPANPDDLSSLLGFAGAIFGVEEPSDLWEQP